jgi:hypothetical protein
MFSVFCSEVLGRKHLSASFCHRAGSGKHLSAACLSGDFLHGSFSCCISNFRLAGVVCGGAVVARKREKRFGLIILFVDFCVGYFIPERSYMYGQEFIIHFSNILMYEDIAQPVYMAPYRYRDSCSGIASVAGAGGRG